MWRMNITIRLGTVLYKLLDPLDNDGRRFEESMYI